MRIETTMDDLYGPLDEKKKKRKKAGSESSKESSLRDWFGRKGAKGKKKGWVDCNAPDGKGGYKSCGRGSDEKRKKYPACRPTPGACKERGKGKSWGKKAKKRKNEEIHMDLEQIIKEELEAVMSENMSADELESQFVKMHQANKGKMNGPMRVILQKLTKLSKQGRYHKNVQAALRKKLKSKQEALSPEKDEMEQIVQEELEAVLDEKRKKKKKKKSSGKKDACYHKVKSRYKVWPSAYASGALVKCRKVGAKNWGNSKKESLEIMIEDELAQVLFEKEEKSNLKAKVIKALRDEGGAAGMDALKKHTKASKEEIDKVVNSSNNIKVHENGDIILMDSLEEKKKKKKACKPSKGKRFAKRVNGKCRSFGQKGQAKGGGDRIRPGTKKGDAYCARSAKIKKCKNPPCANALSRKKWKCRGSKSMKEQDETIN